MMRNELLKLIIPKVNNEKNWIHYVGNRAMECTKRVDPNGHSIGRCCAGKKRLRILIVAHMATIAYYFS